MYGLCDGNNFYVSCHRAFDYGLMGRPVVVLSNNDGNIISRSNEAKALGIPMGAPPFQIRDVLERNKVEIFSSNYTLYGDMSNRVVTVLSRWVPNVEVYSIDESFLDLRGLTDIDAYCRQIRQAVLLSTDIPTCIGVAPSKTLAKLANKRAKKSPTAEGVLVLDSDEGIREAARDYEVADLWGIGRQHSKRLYDQGIHTALQFREMSTAWVKKHMGIVGRRMQEELHGHSCLALELVAPDKQNICSSRSFGHEQHAYEHVAEAVANFAARVGYKLRRQKSKAGYISVFIHQNTYREEHPHCPSIGVQLPVASNSSAELIHYAHVGLRRIFRSGLRYKKAGVIVSDLRPQDHVQLGLFNQSDPRQAVLMDAMDRLNARFGREKVRLAAQGYGRAWRMRQERLTPCYTTRFDELLKIGF